MTLEALTRATTQLAAGDVTFYDSIREAWRACRCSELADLLDKLARTHGRPAIAEAKPKAWHAAWVARARERNPLDLPGLLDGLVVMAQPKQASMIASCLDELAPHSDDPQLVPPLLALLAVPPSSSAWNKVHTRIFALLEAASDPRAIAGLADAIAESRAPHPTWSDAMRTSLARAVRTRERIVERFPDGLPSLPRGFAKVITALAKTAPARGIAPAPRQVADTEALLAAIYEHPDDDARRAVYADALQQRGDPRGEIIALQLAGTPEAASKAARLVEKHRKVLLGGIAKTVIASSAVFERGFLAACETDVRRQAEADAAFGRAEWGTVRRVKFRGFAALTPAMRALEEADGVTESALEVLDELALPRLRVLAIKPNASRGASDGLREGKPGSRGLQALAATTRLPSVRDLRLRLGAYEYSRGGRRARSADDFAWLLAAPVARQIEVLQVPWDQETPGALQSWLPILRTHLTLRELRVWAVAAELAIVKRGDRIAATLSSSRGVDDPWLADSLPTLRAALAEIELSISAR